MYRIILLLFLVAILMPYLLKGAVNECYKTFFDEDKPTKCNFADKCHQNYDCRSHVYNGKGCGGCLPKSFGCKCFECETDLCNDGSNVDSEGGAASRCYWGTKGPGGFPERDCRKMDQGICYKYDCSHINLFNLDSKGCGKCPFGETNLNGCKCSECSDQDLCNGITGIGPSFVLMWVIIGGVVSLLALRPLVSIGIGI